MALTLNQNSMFLRFAFALCIIMLPFNALPYFQSVLREMAAEGAFYATLLLIGAWSAALLRGDKINWPKHRSLGILVLFLCWVMLSSLMNLPWILHLENKGRTGEEKVVFQTVLLCFVAFSSIISFNTLRNFGDKLGTVRRYALYSACIAGAFSLVEIAYFLGIGPASAVLEVVSPLIRTSEDAVYFGRLRSVSGEASWFAMYCSFVFPWILSYVFTERRWLFAFVAFVSYLITLVLLTWSRTAYIITAIQLMVFLAGFTAVGSNTRKSASVFSIVSMLFVSVAVAVSLFGDTIFAERSILSIYTSLMSLETVSNLGRIGSQVAAFEMAMDHPLFGVGFGQYGFYMRDYISSWALISPEVQLWVSRMEGTPWPPVHAVYARLAAEVGFFGLGIWVFLWGTLLRGCYQRFRDNSVVSGQNDTLGLALIVSIIGVLLSGFTTDTLRFFGYWILLGVAWNYLETPVAEPALAAQDLVASAPNVTANENRN